MASDWRAVDGGATDQIHPAECAVQRHDPHHADHGAECAVQVPRSARVDDYDARCASASAAHSVLMPGVVRNECVCIEFPALLCRQSMLAAWMCRVVLEYGCDTLFESV